MSTIMQGTTVRNQKLCKKMSAALSGLPPAAVQRESSAVSEPVVSDGQTLAAHKVEIYASMAHEFDPGWVLADALWSAKRGKR